MDGSISAVQIEVNIRPTNSAATLGASPVKTQETPIGMDVTANIFLLPNFEERAPPNGEQGIFIARDVAAVKTVFISK